MPISIATRQARKDGALSRVTALIEGDDGRKGLRGHRVRCLGCFAYGLLMSVVRAPRTIGLFLLALSVIAAWFINSIAFKAVVFAAGLLFASICWPWLQWLTALLTLAFLAAWGSGSLPLSPSVAPFDDTRTAVLAFAGVVAAATSLAIWQASRWSTELERWVRGLIKRWFGA